VAQTSEGESARVARMGTASIPRLITEFAIPAIAGMLVNGAYNLIDSIFLGQAMGEIGLSATTVAMPSMIVFMAFSMLVGAGGNALAALKLGEGRRDVAEQSLGNTVTLSIILAAIVAILASDGTVLNAMLTISSATDEVRPYAASFLRIICCGFILQCIGMGVNNFIRTAGAPNRALSTMVIGAVVCIVFNYLFVMRMGMGVVGSALATVVGQGVSCACVLWYFIFVKDVPMHLRLSCMRPRARLCGQIVSLGAASFFVQAGSAILNFVTNMQLVKYGVVSPIGAVNALASIGLVQRVAMFTILPLIGMSIAIQPVLGFNYGAKLYRRVRTTLLDGILAATCIAVFMWLIVHLWPRQIVNFFGITDAGLVDFTVFALQVQLLMLPIVGFQIVGSNYFQATGQPLKSSILSLSRQILFLLPLLFIMPEWLPTAFPQYTGLDALYIATPVADGLSILLTFLFVLRELARLNRLIRESKSAGGKKGAGPGAGFGGKQPAARSADAPTAGGEEASDQADAPQAR
jgi:putative MATE family efflux protein